jgi:hypothetical protein
MGRVALGNERHFRRIPLWVVDEAGDCGPNSKNLIAMQNKDSPSRMKEWVLWMR